jgi:hypothetical protein
MIGKSIVLAAPKPTTVDHMNGPFQRIDATTVDNAVRRDRL